jgi:hypothetical protein
MPWARTQAAAAKANAWPIIAARHGQTNLRITLAQTVRAGRISVAAAMQIEFAAVAVNKIPDFHRIKTAQVLPFAAVR